MGDYSGFNDIARRAVIKAFNNLPASLKKAGPNIGSPPATATINANTPNMGPENMPRIIPNVNNTPVKQTWQPGTAPFQNLGLEQMPTVVQNPNSAPNQVRMRLMNARTMMARPYFKQQ